MVVYVYILINVLRPSKVSPAEIKVYTILSIHNLVVVTARIRKFDECLFGGGEGEGAGAATKVVLVGTLRTRVLV
jgi:hypothetical protein